LQYVQQLQEIVQLLEVLPTQFDKWSECVIAGSEITIEYATQMEEQINKDKLYITYFCNENISDKTPT
jgi:hypothetical protein